MAAAPLTLKTLLTLAVTWCPRTARWPHLLDTPDSWGPAHELGHALIEPAWRWPFENYSRCGLGACECGRDLCNVYEAAAMTISHRLLRATGNEFLSEREVNDTQDYDHIEQFHFDRAKALLKRKKLWPVPRTRRSLEAALKRRLVKPRGERIRKPRPSPLQMFAEAIFEGDL